MLRIIMYYCLLLQYATIYKQDDSTMYIWFYPNHPMYSYDKKVLAYQIKSIFLDQVYADYQKRSANNQLTYQETFREGPKPYFSFVGLSNKFRISNDRTISFEAFNMRNIEPVRLDTITMLPELFAKRQDRITLVIPDSVNQKVRLVKSFLITTD